MSFLHIIQLILKNTINFLLCFWIPGLLFTYDEDECSWKLSPAYDLTYSNSIGGEHATTVNGNGVNPELDDILAVAQKIGLNMTMARKTALNIRDCVNEMLGEYL